MASSKKKLKKRNVSSQKQLSLSSARYVGATSNPQANYYRHSQKYSGTISYARTQNMRKAENRLLRSATSSNNKQRRSNAPSAPGYVYSIGSKRGGRKRRK